MLGGRNVGDAYFAASHEKEFVSTIFRDRETQATRAFASRKRCPAQSRACLIRGGHAAGTIEQTAIERSDRLKLWSAAEAELLKMQSSVAGHDFVFRDGVNGIAVNGNSKQIHLIFNRQSENDPPRTRG